MQCKNLCSPLNRHFTWLWHIVDFDIKLRNLLKKTATYFSVFALRVYFGNTVGWDFQKALICKHSLNHKSTCAINPIAQCILLRIQPFYVFTLYPNTFDRHLYLSKNNNISSTVSAVASMGQGGGAIAPSNLGRCPPPQSGLAPATVVSLSLAIRQLRLEKCIKTKKISKSNLKFFKISRFLFSFRNISFIFYFFRNLLKKFFPKQCSPTF